MPMWSGLSGRISELRLERDFTLRDDVEGDETVEALAGVKVDHAPLDAARKTAADVQNLVFGAQHELCPCGRVVRMLAITWEQFEANQQSLAANAADGQRDGEFASPGFGELAAAQAGPDEVQLGLAHGGR